MSESKTQPEQPSNAAYHQLARHIAQRYSEVPQVETVALGGSLSAHTDDSGSDLDLYVYTRDDIPRDVRADIASEQSQHMEIDNQFWEPGDEWIDPDTGIHVDVMFRSCTWIEEQLDRVLQHHQSSLGYSTCLWHNVLASQILYDRNAWFAQLQQKANQPYPKALQRAIIARNYPLLRDTLSSYLHQMQLAVARRDIVSINHRATTFLASYFDILFAINRLPHPGEKRLLPIIATHCAKVPPAMEEQMHLFVQSIVYHERIIDQAHLLVDELAALLNAEGLNQE